MRIFLRSTLKTTLRALSKWAIRKHNISFICISGWHGTWIVKESMYKVLNEDYKVRRNVDDVTWDFSIPLTILGYDDLPYSFKGWFQIISSTLWVLIFEKSNPHIQILELDATKEDIYKYWLSIISPDHLILVNTRPGMESVEDLLAASVVEDGDIVCSDAQWNRFKANKSVADYVDFHSIESIKEKNIELKKYPKFISDSMLFVIPVAENLGIEEKIVIKRLNEFEVPEDILKAFYSSIKKEK